MANTKISDLTAATTAGSTDVLPIVQGGATKKVPVSVLTPDGSTTTKGLVEFATTTETTAGTSSSLAVTPAGLKAVTDALPTGGGTGITAGTTAGQIPVWDGNSYEPQSPTDPQASEVAFTPTGSIAATNVQAAIAEVAAEAAGGGTGSRPGYRSGTWHSAATGHTSGTAVASDNDLQAMPFVVDKATTFDRLGCAITVAGTAGFTEHLALYADNGFGYPGALLASGQVAGDAVAAPEVTINQALSAGVYWLASKAESPNSGTTPPTMRTLSGASRWVATTNIPGGTLNTAYSIVQPEGALPTTFPAGATIASSTARVSMRVA